MRNRLVITSCFFLMSSFGLFSNCAWAGPPFITDDPEPVKYQRWEINYAVSRVWHEGSISSGLPSIDINYGMAPNIQLHLQPRYSSEKTGTGKNVGVDDTEIGHGSKPGRFSEH